MTWLTRVIMPVAPDITLESKVAFLRQPTSFREAAYRVEAIETHMSWVFLTDDFAYKLKKPVRNALLDFRSLEARHYFCKEELRLNRRLAAPVYLGLVALSIDALGDLHLEGHGIVIDWLVKMRRLPTQHMLDYKLNNGTASADDMCRVAKRLTAFYRDSQVVTLDPVAYRAALLRDINRNQEALSQVAYGLAIEQVNRLCHAHRNVLEKRRDWFDARVRNGKIVEGHGDLRPEHICLAPEVVVIDCLEFSRDLRIVDAADELAFLALECERLGMPDLGRVLLLTYGALSGDWPDAGLLHFYQSYRAAVRARIAIQHLDEEKFRYSGQWRRRANDYLRLAQTHQNSISSVIDSPA